MTTVDTSEVSHFAGIINRCLPSIREVIAADFFGVKDAAVAIVSQQGDDELTVVPRTALLRMAVQAGADPTTLATLRDPARGLQCPVLAISMEYPGSLVCMRIAVGFPSMGGDA
jgi:hypothetical protein